MAHTLISKAKRIYLAIDGTTNEITAELLAERHGNTINPEIGSS